MFNKLEDMRDKVALLLESIDLKLAESTDVRAAKYYESIGNLVEQAKESIEKAMAYSA